MKMSPKFSLFFLLLGFRVLVDTQKPCFSPFLFFFFCRHFSSPTQKRVSRKREKEKKRGNVVEHDEPRRRIVRWSRRGERRRGRREEDPLLLSSERSARDVRGLAERVLGAGERCGAVRCHFFCSGFETTVFLKNSNLCAFPPFWCALTLSLSLSLSFSLFLFERVASETSSRNSRHSFRLYRKSTTSPCTIYTRNSCPQSRKNRPRNSSKF